MVRSTLRPILIGTSVALAIAASACGSDGEADPTTVPGGFGATPVPTASPLASVPPPKILDTTGDPGTDEPTTEAMSYVVVPGDTLSRIAQEFGTSVEALTEANELTSTNIFVGQELLIPGTNNGAASTPTPPPNTTITTYVVQPGDTGFGIALKFDTTLEAIAAANGLSVDHLEGLTIGQELLIPPP